MLNQVIGEIKKSFSKVIREDQGNFTLLTLFIDNEPKYVLCLTIGDEYIYGKVVSLEKVFTVSCHEILYFPHGLYIFARSVEEFSSKLLEKVKLLI